MLQQSIPNSYGDCNDNGPPAPCECSPGCANLYYIHKSWVYKAYARWISGLRSGSLASVVFSDAGSVITVDVKGSFAQLPLSLWIGECLTFDQCVEIWDNTEGCCGTDKHFQVNISVNCKNDSPYLYNIKLDEVTLDKFEITEKIVGITVDLDDITSSIENTVSGLLSTYLTTEKFIPYNGTMVTVLDFANAEIEAYTHGFFACPTNSTTKYTFLN